MRFLILADDDNVITKIQAAHALIDPEYNKHSDTMTKQKEAIQWLTGEVTEVEHPYSMMGIRNLNYDGVIVHTSYLYDDKIVRAMIERALPVLFINVRTSKSNDILAKTCGNFTKNGIRISAVFFADSPTKAYIRRMRELFCS